MNCDNVWEQTLNPSRRKARKYGRMARRSMMLRGAFTIICVTFYVCLLCLLEKQGSTEEWQGGQWCWGVPSHFQLIFWFSMLVLRYHQLQQENFTLPFAVRYRYSHNATYISVTAQLSSLFSRGGAYPHPQTSLFYVSIIALACLQESPLFWWAGKPDDIFWTISLIL